MADRQVFIHAGLPKAGSTFLQANVFPLLELQAISVNPGTSQALLTETAMEAIARGTIPDAELASRKESLQEMIQAAPHDKVLISTEALLPFHLGSFDAVDAILASCKKLLPDAKLIVVLRNQLNWLLSAYSFFNESRLTVGTEYYFRRGHVDDNELAVSVFDFDYRKIDELISRHFDSIHYLNFEQLTTNSTYLKSAFDSIFSSDLPLIPTNKRVNPSLDKRLLAIIDMLERMWHGRLSWKVELLYPEHVDIPLQRALYRKAVLFKSKLNVKIARLLFRLTHIGKGRPLMDANLRADLESYYQPRNAAFWNKHPTV